MVFVTKETRALHEAATAGAQSRRRCTIWGRDRNALQGL